MTPPTAPLRSRYRRRRGQAVLEMALVGPVLVMLLLSSVQIGQIAYSSVSLDSDVREGARAGAAAPNAALTTGGVTWYSTSTPTHTCNSTDFDETSGNGNPICIAILNAAGFLSQSTFTTNPCAAGQACVTITVVQPNQLTSSVQQPAVAHLLSSGSPCNSGRQATVTGTVSGIPNGMSATVTDTSGDTQSGVVGAYTLCVAASGGSTSQTITAQVGPVSCGGYSGSVGPFNVTHGQTYTGYGNITVVAEPACPTPTPTPTPTATPTPTPTPTAGPTPTPTAGPSVSCGSETVPDSYYIRVSATYPVPIFVPFVGQIFQTQPGLRQITSSVTDPIDPCTLTEGA